MDKGLRKSIDELANIVSQIIPIPKDFNLSKSLKSNGVDIRYFTDKKYDAFLQWNYKKNCPVISVNATQPLVRRNFSMAHELGHLVIDYKWNPFSGKINVNHKRLLSVKYRGGDYNSVAEKNDETVVNEFAAAFLIPNRLIKEEIENSDPDYLKLIDQLSNKFKVSNDMARIRLNNFLDGVE
ncbi:hypothetical protein WR164_12490 [Philodulcilactobacillus myokoensis]|uniref:IrrE N-terminal-like domain-containing protein n=1 Tax=Philodulcilactobacillus myokoensis TaxID=2929573 RepID=A0A9W6ESY3_9LACO|nr:ImmA/IrrE family metallo-endopeptidase [Philodulcilactobacillus myokoensis]GLB47270.1 hypothetical protein WR164_12490 [Philodulcilactobacillus myokoensis]